MKPFRPPLLKHRPQSQEKHVGTCRNERAIEPFPKRRKISQEQEDGTVAVKQLFPAPSHESQTRLSKECPNKPLLAPRRPLIARNLPNLQESQHERGRLEDYYLVLWRRPTAKKNKIWDGDGLLSVRDGHTKLQDINGRELGRIGHSGPLLPGSTLSIGGKDVEVDSVISRDEYLKRRSPKEVQKVSPDDPHMIKSNPSSTSPSTTQQPSLRASKTTLPSSLISKPAKRTAEEEPKKTLNNAAPRSTTSSAAFKNPIKNSTVMLQHSGSRPTPRHDPNAKGAIVMRRPKNIPSGKDVVDVVIDPELSRKLRDHQMEGVKFLYECAMGIRDFGGEGAILADEMGLGKSLQTITLLWTLLKQNPILHDPPRPVVKKALIVCPVTLIDNWRKEFRKWLGNERIGVFVADGKQTRLTDFTMGKAYSVMIIGYERLRTVAEDLTRGSGIDIVIADEGHRLKTVQNKSAQAIQTLNTPRRIILSGTPIQNDLSEFFCMVNFVNDGILGSYKSFVKSFETPILKSRQPNAIQQDIENGEAMSEELASLTSPFILRRTAEILEKFLPFKTEYVLFCNPTPTQALIYRNVLASPLFQFALGNGSESALQLITILKKLCNSPSLLNPKAGAVDDSGTSASLKDLLSSLSSAQIRKLTNASSAKIRILDSLIMSLRHRTDEKIVLVSNYTSTLDILQSLLTSLSVSFLRLDGSTPASKRQGLVDDFNRPSGKIFAFLLSAKAGGLGLNLIGASRLVLFDVDWNPATDMQAMARVHREGQKREVKIYRLVMKGTVEERIWMRQVEKGGLANSVLELGGNAGNSSGQWAGKKGALAQFSREELRDLFRLEEGRGLKTHELIGCQCEGQGFTVPSSPKKDSGGGSMTSCHFEGQNTIDAAKPITAKPMPNHPSKQVKRKRRLQILDSESDSMSECDSASDSDADTLPSSHSLLQPTVASALDINPQESLVAEGPHPLQPPPPQNKPTKAAGAASLLSTKHYGHFDTNSVITTSQPDEDRWEDKLGDEVLCNVIKEQNRDVDGLNLVGWVFKRTTEKARAVAAEEGKGEAEVER